MARKNVKDQPDNFKMKPLGEMTSLEVQTKEKSRKKEELKK